MFSIYIFLIVAVFFAVLPSRAQELSASASSGRVEIRRDSIGQELQSSIWAAHVLRRTPKDKAILGLHFPDRQIPVMMVAKSQRLRPVVEVRGTFQRPGWRLFVQGENPVYATSNSSEFVFYAHLNGPLSAVDLVSRGPEGTEPQVEQIFIYAPQIRDLKVISAWNETMLSVGIAALQFTQSRLGDYSSVNGLFSARYLTPDRSENRWGLALGLDATVFTLVSIPARNAPQFLQMSADLTYTLQASHEFRTQALAGVHYMSLLANGSPYGFNNLVAPEWGVRVGWTKSPTSAWVLDLRMTSIKGLIDFSRRGVDVQIGWNRLLENLHRFEIGLGLNSLIFESTNGAVIQNSLGSVKFGYSF